MPWMVMGMIELWLNHDRTVYFRTLFNLGATWLTIPSMKAFKVCLHVTCPLFTPWLFSIVLMVMVWITDRIGPSSILSIIHTVTIGTMLNNKGDKNGHVMCKQTLIPDLAHRIVLYQYIQIQYHGCSKLNSPFRVISLRCTLQGNDGG